MSTRSKKMVSMLKDDKILENLKIPSHESTKGTTSLEKTMAIAGLTKKIAVISPFASPNTKTPTNEELSASDEDPFADSGSEYVPSSYHSDSENEDVIPLQNLITFRHGDFHEEFLEHNNNSNNYAASTSSNQIPLKESLKTTSTAITAKSVLNQKSLPKTDSDLSKNDLNKAEGRAVVIDHSKRKNGKRVRDKVHSCYFCNKLYSNNLSRHYQRVHGNETEIVRIFAITDPKKRRERLINLIRNGDFYHNCEVLTLKKGELILSRRPSQKELQFSSYSDYGPCPQCLGFLLKRHIWHHLKYSCKAKHDDKPESSEKRTVIAESTALLNGIIYKSLSEKFVTNIVNKFKNDEISKICKEDSTILKYGSFLFEKYDTTQAELIRQSMHQLARLILEARKICHCLISLEELLSPENFDNVISATKQLCICQKDNNVYRPQFNIPSLALKLGYSLKKCCAIKRGEALRRGDLSGNEKLLSFLTLLKIEWSVRISSNAKATLETRKINATDLLPLTSDLLKLRQYLDSHIQNLKKKVLLSFTKNNWVDLASMTLVRIILFNKRRSGEASKITLTQYSSRPSNKELGTEEIKKSLTNFEKKLASSLTLIQVVGKRGRRVPIIISNEVKETLDILISTRVKAGVNCENPYIFAIPETTASFMRGHICVKKWCSEASLQYPDLITGTRLRKYVATVCQIFDLTENEQDWLARHLGHDIRVHREFYRLQENAVELTKISRLLIAVDQGETSKFSGKKLNEINIEDLPSLDDENDENYDLDKEDGEYEEASEKETSMEIDEEINMNKKKKGAAANHILSEEEIDMEISEVNNKSKKKKGKNTKKSGEKRKQRICTKHPWSNEEKEIVGREMKSYIKKNSLPGKEVCTKLIEKHEELKGRKWTDIKFYIKNYLTKINKKT